MTMIVFPSINSVGGTSGRYYSEYNVSKLFGNYAQGDGGFISGCTMPAASTAGNKTIKLSSGEALVSGYVVRHTSASVISVTSGTKYVYVKLTRDGSNHISASSFKVTTSTTWPTDSLYVGKTVAGATKVTGTSFANRGWRTPTLGSSWANYGSGYEPIGYKKISGDRVAIKGLVHRATTAGGSTMCTLPSGFKPRYTKMFVGISNNMTLARIDIKSNGSIVHYSGDPDYISLEAIEFDIIS
jgi:hypothetical protein